MNKEWIRMREESSKNELIDYFYRHEHELSMEQKIFIRDLIIKKTRENRLESQQWHESRMFDAAVQELIRRGLKREINKNNKNIGYNLVELMGKIVHEAHKTKGVNLHEWTITEV